MSNCARDDAEVLRAIGWAAPVGLCPEFILDESSASLLSTSMRTAMLSRTYGPHAFAVLGVDDSALARFVGPVVVADPDHLPTWAELLIWLIDWWSKQQESTWAHAVRELLDTRLADKSLEFSEAARQVLVDQAFNSGTPPESPRELLVNYPARAYAQAMSIYRTLENISEFADRLVSDRDEVTELIGSSCEAISHLEVNCGDPHDGQRSVMVVTFNSGARVVYKTKDLRVQELWNEVLGRIESEFEHTFNFSGPLPLPIKVHVDYAWVAFVEQSPAIDDPEATRRFMIRMGALAFVAGKLRANDLWGDNLVTVTDQPFIIDVETVLQPSIDGNIDAPHLLTGIVSLPTSAHPDLPAAELGALTYSTDISSGIEMQSSQMRRGSGFDAVTHLDEQGRSWMSMVMDERRPTLSGEPPDIFVFWEEFAAGYRCAAQALLADSAWLEKELRHHSNDRSRLIVQGTFDYYRAMQSSWDPRFHFETRRRTLAIMRTMHSWHGKTFVDIPALSWEEARMITDGDIPYFTTRADDTQLYSGQLPLGAVAHVDGITAIREGVGNVGTVHDELTEIRAQASSDLRDLRAPRGLQRVPVAPQQDIDFIEIAQPLIDSIEQWLADPRFRGMVEEPDSAMRTVGSVPFDIWNGRAAAGLLMVEAGRDPRGEKLAQAIDADLVTAMSWGSELRGPWLHPVSGVLVGLLAGTSAAIQSAQRAAHALAAMSLGLASQGATRHLRPEDGLGDARWSASIFQAAGSALPEMLDVANGDPAYWGVLPTTQIRRQQVEHSDPWTLGTAELIALGEIPGREGDAAFVLSTQQLETGRWLSDRLAGDELLMSGVWGLVGVARTLLRAGGVSIPTFRDQVLVRADA